MSPQSRLEGPSHGVKLRQEDTSVFVDGKRLGSGSLLIAESCVYWRSPSGERLSLEYTSISLHAVSRDLANFPHEHLYMLLNGKLPGENPARAEAGGGGGGGDEEEEEEVEEDLEPVTELRFVPPDSAALDGMFAALCECQALHPDPDDASSEDSESEDDDDDDDDEGVEGAGDVGRLPDDVAVESLTPAGRAVLARLEGMLSDVPNFGDMAGVQSQNGQEADNDAMDVDASRGEHGQFDDADLDK